MGDLIKEEMEVGQYKQVASNTMATSCNPWQSQVGFFGGAR